MRTRFTLLALCLTALLASCVRQDMKECPPEAAKNLIIDIRDKNYSNISAIEGLVPIDEDLPFIEYVAPLYMLCVEAEEDMIHVHPIPLNQTSKEAYPDISSIPANKERVGIVGNLELPEDVYSYEMAFELHPENNEHLDFYVAYDEIDFPLEEDYTIELYRAKGKLVAMFENLPDKIENIEILANNVSKTLNRNLVYSDATNVNKFFRIGASDSNPTVNMLLAPSRNNNTSSFTITLLDNNNNVITTFSNINLAVRRNTITAIRSVYDDEEDEWTFDWSIDGSWQRIHELQID